MISCLIAGMLGCGGGPMIFFPSLAWASLRACRKAWAFMVIRARPCRPVHDRTSK